MFQKNPLKELERKAKKRGINLTKNARQNLSEDFFSLYPIVNSMIERLMVGKRILISKPYRVDFSGEITIERGEEVIAKGEYKAVCESRYREERISCKVESFKYRLTFLDTPVVENYSQAVFWEIEIGGRVFHSYRVGIEGWDDDFLRELSALIPDITEPRALVFLPTQTAEEILESFFNEREN